MIINFLIGIIVYSLLAFTSYSEVLKASRLYFALGLGLAIAANAAWLHLARQSNDPSKLLLIGLYWDIMLTVTYLLVPILMFGARLTFIQGLGVAAIFAGIIMTKL